MIVKHIDEIKGTERDVEGGNWVSRRLLLASDGMGFSMHETIIRAGTETLIWYKYHLEAVYCVEGQGEIEDLQTGIVHEIRPGTLYALNEHDRHLLRSTTADLRLVCTFNPPITGREIHDADGSYELVPTTSPYAMKRSLTDVYFD